jgi:hypothetical protein
MIRILIAVFCGERWERRETKLTRCKSNLLQRIGSRIALLNMSAEAGSTTLLNGAHHATLLWQQRMHEAKGVTVLAEDIGHL